MIHTSTCLPTHLPHLESTHREATYYSKGLIFRTCHSVHFHANTIILVWPEVIHTFLFDIPTKDPLAGTTFVFCMNHTLSVIKCLTPF